MRQNHVTKRRPSDRKLKKLNAILEVATSRLSRLHKGVILEVFIVPNGLAAGCNNVVDFRFGIVNECVLFFAGVFSVIF